MKFSKFLLCLALGIASQYASAQIYKIVGDDGSITYTDQAPATGPAEPAELPQIIIQPAVRVPAAAPADVAASSPATRVTSAPDAISIATPTDETVIHGSAKQIPVSANVRPAPSGEWLFQLLHNGTPYGAPQSDPNWTSPALFAGMQSLEVQVLGKEGSLLSTSDAVRVYVIP